MVIILKFTIKKFKKLVGHCHPIVVESISKQLATSTCNIRFVSSKLTECAEEILKTLIGFDTLLFCNSG